MAQSRMGRLFFCFVFLVWPSLVGSATVHDRQMIQWHGVQRSFYLHRPEDLQSLAPLVIVLHGLGGSAEKLRFGLGFNQLANQKKFAVVYPQGLPAGNASSHWNPGFDFSTVDDLGFLVTLKRFLTRQYDLNDRRVFVVGVSNGGYMAYHLACHAPEHFAAFVSVIGTIGGADWRKCQPRRAIPLMHIHGTEDPMIRYDGIPSWYSGWGGQPDVHSVVTSWAQRVGASLYDTNTTRPNTTAIKYRNPETQAEVWLMRLNGFGHDWPHSGNIGYNMTEEIWKFFETVPYR